MREQSCDNHKKIHNKQINCEAVLPLLYMDLPPIADHRPPVQSNHLQSLYLLSICLPSVLQRSERVLLPLEPNLDATDALHRVFKLGLDAQNSLAVECGSRPVI